VLPINEIIQGDCLEVLSTIPDESVDCVITDPPYGTNDGKGKVIRRGKTDTDFGVIDWDVEVPLSFIVDLKRIMKEDTWGVIFTDNVFISSLWYELEKVGLKPRNTFYWIKPNKAPTPRSNFKSAVETAVVFTKGRTNQKWLGGGNKPNYVEIPFVSGKEKVKHPTQKPVTLFEYLIKLFSGEKDIILDPFLGSGTTAVASINLNRKYIGIEKDPEYCKIARERVKRAESKRKLFYV